MEQDPTKFQAFPEDFIVDGKKIGSIKEDESKEE